MRRVQFYIQKSIDDTLETEAARRGVSKASLIRDALAKEFQSAEPEPDDPWMAMLGRFEGEPVDDIDEVVYGRKAHDR
jgi:hypothetical protein